MENLPENVHNSPSVPTPSYTNIADGYQAALKVVDDVVLKNYVSELSNMEIVPRPFRRGPPRFFRPG